MLGLFEYHPKKEAEIQLSQRWLQLIQTREQLIQARIRFCITPAGLTKTIKTPLMMAVAIIVEKTSPFGLKNRL